jgi:hypothetical protein
VWRWSSSWLPCSPGVGYFRGLVQPARRVRSSLLPPPNTSFLPSNFEISPDGTRLAFVAAGQDGSIALWVRVLSAAGAQQVNGADHARFPFWSPDSRYLGFFTAGKLKTVDVASGEAHILCGAPAGMGGSWSGDGTIVFAPNIAGPLYRIAAGGGVPAPITPIPVESSGQNHGGPWFLPDGKHFLYSALHSAPSDRQGNGIYIGSLGSTDVRLVSSGLAGKVAFSSGQLLYVQAGNLLAQPFDPKRFTTTGPPTVIEEQELDPDPGFWGSTFSVSQTGLLAFQSTADSMSHLVWTDESGKSLGQISEAWYKDPSLSTRRPAAGNLVRRRPQRQTLHPRLRSGAPYLPGGGRRLASSRGSIEGRQHGGQWLVDRRRLAAGKTPEWHS